MVSMISASVNRSYKFSGGFTKDRSWLGACDRLDASEVRTSGQAIVAAGLDWEVYRMGVNSGCIEIPGYKALMRSDNGTVLDIVSDRYYPLQNRDAFGFFDKLLESQDVSIESAGSLDSGRKVWVYARTTSIDTISGGDRLTKDLLLVNSHDRSTAISIRVLNRRLECENQIASLMRGRAATNCLTVRHTRDAANQIASFSRFIGMSGKSFEADVQLYRSLAATELTEHSLNDYLTDVFTKELKAMQAHQVQKTGDSVAMPRIQEMRGYGAIRDRFENAWQSEGLAQQDTSLWGALNAITYWTSHQRSSSSEGAMKSLMFGSSQSINERATESAAAMIGV